MIPSYTIEYTVPLRRHNPPTVLHYGTDDPVAAEEFLVEMLEKGFHLKIIRHEGEELPRVDADRMIRTAVGMLAAKRICASLGIDSDEEKYRFGLPA